MRARTFFVFDDHIYSRLLTVVPQITRKRRRKKTKKGNRKPAKQIVFGAYKQRGEIETLFDIYNNYLDADVSYMQNRYVMEGWLFANFIAMMAYYKLYVRQGT